MTGEEINNYVKQSLDFGVNEDEIIKNLLQDGVQEEKIKQAISNAKNKIKEKSDKFWLGFIPKRLPSLILFILGTIPLVFVLFTISQNNGIPDTSTGFEGLGVLLFLVVAAASIYVAIFLFVLSFLLRNFSFKSFFKKETYVKNTGTFIVLIVIVLIFIVFFPMFGGVIFDLLKSLMR
jgi:magnesium-transporting ATPase (P-type)